jgi:hypothetical protein
MAGVKHKERPEVGRNVNVRSDTYGQKSSKRSCTTFYAGMVCVCLALSDFRERRSNSLCKAGGVTFRFGGNACVVRASNGCRVAYVKRLATMHGE